MSDGDQLMNLLKKISVEQNFHKCEIQVTPTSSGGGNFSSKLYRITISGEGKDDLKLFGKVGVLGEKLRCGTPLQPFNSEKLVYTELMKAYRDLEEKHGVSEENRLKFPAYYGVDMTYLHEIIVLEDLTSRGFGSANRFESVDWQYASAAITELAKFHALSIAYEHECPKEFENIVTRLPSGLYNETEQTVSFFNGSAKLALETVRDENKEKLKQFLDGESVVTFSNMFQALKRRVLIHVDFRPDNMLHRVKNDGTVEVIPVDYQTIQAGSPVIDLLYFIFTATDGQFRAKYYQKLVNHYHTELGVALARLGINVEDKYARKDFELERKEKLRYGLLTSVFVLPILTVPEDQAPAINDELDISSFAIPTPGAQYYGRLNEAVDDYVTWGVL